MAAINFIPFNGKARSLATNENHLVFKWVKGDVLFSVTKHGNAASCHFDCSKSDLRNLKTAIDEFCEFVFYLFDWCKMIIAMINKPSVARLVEKLDFKIAYLNGDAKVYVRLKNGVC